MADMIGGMSAGDKRRRAEKETSGRLRGRKQFDDQSSVDKLYQWMKKGFERKPFIGPADIEYELRKRNWNKK